MSFANKLRMNARSLSWLSVAALILATMLPALLTTKPTDALQLTSRAAALSTSVAGTSDVSIEFEFVIATTGVVDSLAIQYCDDSPIISDTTCSDARSFSWFDSAYTDIALSNQNGTNVTTGTVGDSGVTDWVVDDSTDSNGLVLTTATAASLTAGDIVTFTVGAGGGTDGVDLPTGTNSAFYFRLHTYDDFNAMPCTTSGPCDQGGASDFDWDNGTLGQIDDGGIAVSTAEQITITARVQERMTFCVGTADPTASCGGVSGSTIDLGILDDLTINKASNVGDGPGVENAYVQITTNATSGAVIQYFGDNLKVSGATCGTVNDDANTGSVIDQCLNYDDDPDAGTSTGALAAGTEQWGFGITAITDDAGGVTSNLAAESEYDVDAGDEFAYDANTTTQLANTTSSVTSSEQLTLDFGATAEITTPPGLYSTTLTFIATGTF